MAMAWRGDQKSVQEDRNVSAVAGPCLHSIKASSICHTPCKPGAWEGAQPGQLTTGMFHAILHHAQHMEEVEEKSEICQYSPRIPKQLLPMVKLSFTKNG